MHPHPGFPVLARLDDVCSVCADSPFPPATEKKVEKKLEVPMQLSSYPTASSLRRITAIAAVALFVFGAMRRKS
eukprot:CAMPEP_0119075470 /NCGR_PEP_ID=MMETSP1178-20130426/80543_1 /TAXON_ID=33656 /ORGANISM="unid sp, Strain CCMP2000" /LENGTH=73 /DNA_ID=CAMNT_0007057691 /DNA_START=49 /DNA_END=270 /DNA_ORIENTATION=+